MGRKIIIGMAAVVGMVGVALAGERLPPFGGKVEGKRLERVEASKHFADGLAQNLIPTSLGMNREMFGAMGRYLRGGQNPDVPIPVERPSFSDDLAEAFTMTWLGHSSVLLEIGGVRVLTDPVFSKRASPFQWMGPARFHETPVSLDELPKLDAVLISHDHYDHLDMGTIAALIDRDIPFLVPLGVGAHLEAWGVPDENIIEMEWWDAFELGEARVVCTPARHFSGRGMTDRNRTLWASWAVIGPEHRVWFSGDTGPFPQAEEIGERLGPFDLSMIEIGAYDRAWGQIHLGPDEALAMHKQVRGKRMFPVHWGTFNLAAHRWDQPIVRLIEQSELVGVDLLVPVAGQTVDAGEAFIAEMWLGRSAIWAESGRDTLDE